MILVEFADHVLAFTEEEFEAARLRGLELMPTAPIAGNSAALGAEILDTSGMEAATGVPASWWAQAAREGTVPHLRLGKYIRFSLREALEAANGKRRPGNGQ